MGTISNESGLNGIQPENNRVEQLKAFDETKKGVKGLVDSGTKTIPSIFIRPSDELSEELKIPNVERQVPIIDFKGIDGKDGYEEIVKQVLEASQKWGFFQVVNHGIPTHVLDKMLDGLRMFHEQDDEIKKQFYSRDLLTGKTFVYNSNYDLYKSRAANWRDSLAVNAYYSNAHFDPQQIPEIFRDACLEYINEVRKLGDILLELISVGLGLEPDYLKEKLECSKGWSLVNHYYPACPAPELTIGTNKHTDPSFLTILLQDQMIGGLQVFNDNQWVHVQPIPGAFVLNIGDILQILSNDKLKSVYHRVKSNLVGPRVSVAFFLKGLLSSPKLYGPIQELLSQQNPSVYRDFTLSEFQTMFFTSPLGHRILDTLKIQD